MVGPEDYGENLGDCGSDDVNPLLSPRTQQSIKKLIGVSSLGIRLRGPFASWVQARKKSTGYDSEEILSAVLSAAQSAQGQESLFEKDGVLVGPERRSWPVTASLLFAGATLHHKFRVLDFGGSLGSTYFHVLDFLEATELEWVVVEQKTYAEAGRRYFENERLIFVDDLNLGVDNSLALVALLSSSLQYVENPFGVLQSLLDLKPEFVIFDRTPFHEGADDVLMVQHVSREVYRGSYPIWILSKSKLMRYMSDGYELVTTFDSPEGTVFTRSIDATFQGMFFRTRKQ